MPKIVANPKTRAEIQKASDERNGIIKKTFSMHKEDVELLKQLSEQTGISQAKLIGLALKALDPKNL